MPQAANLPMSGLSAWLITDGKQGMDVQVRGVADALELDYQMRPIAPTWLTRYTAPYGPPPRSAFIARKGSKFGPPWPAVALATGRQSIPYIRAIGRLAGQATYRIVLQDPKTRSDTADVIWVPQHDKRRASNVITTRTAPHSFTQQRLIQLRARLPESITALPGPLICVVLGGRNAIYQFNAEDDARFHKALKSLASLGGSFLITSSRRTHDGLLNAAVSATGDSPRIIYSGDGPNPYPDFLAAADCLVVTADSVNMTGEATATGRPVYVFEPTGGSAKFARFHKALRDYGATRQLPETCETLPDWSYAPLDAAHDIARQIEQRWLDSKTPKSD